MVIPQNRSNLNVVIAGDYKGDIIQINLKREFYIRHKVSAFSHEKIPLNSETISRVKIMDGGSRKKMNLVGGIVGGALCGPVGAVIGAAQGKGVKDVRLAIYFKNGKRSLINCSTECFRYIQQSIF